MGGKIQANIPWQLAKKEVPVAQKQHDRDIASIVLELQNRPETIVACLRAVQGNAFVPKDQLEMDFTPGTNFMYKLPKQFLENIILARAPHMSDKLAKVAKASKLGVHRIFYRAALCDQGTSVTQKNKAAYEDILSRSMKDVNFNFKGLALLESGDVDWSECGAYRLMPKRPLDHKGTWKYESLQFHGGKAEVSMKAMNLTIDERACIQEPWSIKRATLILNKGTDMETNKCADIFKKDETVTSLLQFAIKTGPAAEASDKEESDDGGAAPSTIRLAKDTAGVAPRSHSTPSKNPPTDARKVLSPAQRKALQALKATGTA